MIVSFMVAKGSGSQTAGREQSRGFCFPAQAFVGIAQTSTDHDIRKFSFQLADLATGKGNK
jgi:hypothetical protein